MNRIVAVTDLFLPSNAELTLLTDSQEEALAIRELFGRGVKAIVHKNGSEGATYHDVNGSVSVAGFPVDEIDPTGAGDSFGGAFSALWLRNSANEQALTIAAAAGALAVTKRGPMEGTSDMQTVEGFIQASDKATQ